ncbi:MAG: tetratricopeptide repeat protein [Brachymonas sp.]|nr:tetratricopeptide repeat protein [Brachymonas sp.]
MQRPARRPLLSSTLARTLTRPPLAVGAACLASALLISPAQANTAGTQAARDIGAPAALPASAPAGKRARNSANTNNSDLQAVLKKSAGLYHALLGYLYLQGGNTAQAYANLMGAARQAPDAQLYQLATEIALRERLPGFALRSLERWKADFPNDTQANLFHLQLLIASNRLAHTTAVLQTALDGAQGGKKQTFIHAIPELYEATKKPQIALAAAAPVLEQAMQQRETTFIAASSLARMQMAARQYPQALQSLQHALAAPVPSEKLGALPNRELPGLIAMDLMQASKASAPETSRGAEAIVRKEMAQKPSRDFALVYTRFLIQARRLTDAQQVLDTVLKQTPDFAAGWFFQGTLQMESKQWAAAQNSLQHYLKLRQAVLSSPSATMEMPGIDATDNSNDSQQDAQQITARDLQVYLMLARIADAHNQPQEARQWIARISHPLISKQAQLQRIEWLVQEGKFDLAQQLLPQLPTTTPQEKAALALLHSHILEKQERFAQALNVLNQALRADPEHAELLYARGNLYWQMERFAELEQDMRQVMRLQPESPAAYNALGYHLADRNLRLNEARELIAKAIELAPDSAAIQDSMGWVEYRLGNLPQAIKWLKQAFENEPEAEIAAHYGEALWQNGQTEEARQVWAQGLKLDAKHKVLLETMQRLTGAKPAPATQPPAAAPAATPAPAAPVTPASAP